MFSRFLFVGGAAAFLVVTGPAMAQTTPPIESLSQVERAAATGLIDRLHSTDPTAFSAELSGVISRLNGLGLDVKPAIAVLKASAGDRLQTVNDALGSLCRDAQPAQKKTYCDVAQVADPRTADVQTAAVGAAAGGALGGPISSSSASAGGGGGNAGGSDSSTRNTPPNLSLRGGSGGGGGRRHGGRRLHDRRHHRASAAGRRRPRFARACGRSLCRVPDAASDLGPLAARLRPIRRADARAAAHALRAPLLRWLRFCVVEAGNRCGRIPAVRAR